MRVNRFLILIVSVLMRYTAYAQSEQMIHYTNKDGLTGNVVYHIFPDSKGYLWISTSDGVSRFDGREFVNFSVKDGLPDNDVFIVDEDALGRIWFGTYKSELSYFENDSIHPFIFNRQLKERYPEKTVKLGFYFDQVGNLYLADQKYALIKVDTIGVIHTIGGIENNIYDFGDKVLTATNKNVKTTQFGGRVQGYRLYDAVDNFKILDSLQYPLPENRSKGSHYCIKVDDESYLLIKGDYIWHINPDSTYFTDSKDYLDCLYKDSKGFIWMGTQLNGVYVFRDATLKDTVAHLLKGLTITNVCQDFEGGLWISSLGNGIYNLPYCNFIRIVTTTLPDHSMVKIVNGPEDKLFVLFDHSEVWFGNKEHWQFYSKRDYENVWEHNTLFYEEETNTVYLKSRPIHTNLGLPVKYKRLALRHEVNPKSYLYHVLKYRDEILEFRGRGIYKYGRPKRYLFDDRIFNSNRILDVTVHNDTIWISTLQGIYTLVNDSVQFVNNPAIGDKAVLQILYRGEERIIVTENYGILFEKEGKRKWVTHRELLPIGLTKCLIDDEGVLWIGTKVGLYYMGVDDQVVKKLSVQRGIGNQQVNDLFFKNRIIYLATDHGLIELDRNELDSVIIIPPKIYLSIESVNGKKWKMQDGNVFDFDQNNIMIKMTAVAFSNQNDLVFEWKVDGLDENWNINRSDKLAFSRLSYGTYKLSVRSKNAAGVYSEVRELKFVIKPAFWQRFEFIVFSLFMLGLMIFSVFYYWLSAFKKRSKRNLELIKEKSDLEIRALRAQMNPHFVFNSLTSIQYLINLKKNEEAEFYLNKFSRLLRLIVDHAGQTEITILNELDLLRIFVDLENLRYEDKFEFDVDIDDEIDIDMVLIPGIIVQPFVENAIEHGLSKKEGKGTLYLGIKKINTSLIVIIEDDGIGREKAAELRKISGKVGKSIGVLNVKRRMELLKLGNRQDDYNFEIEDLYDQNGLACGTRVTLKLPYLLNET